MLDDHLLATGDRGDEAAAGRPQQVPVNMYETDRAVVVVAPLPGVMADDVTVTVDDRQVTIAADLRTEAPKEYLLHEWHYGPYERTLDIPEGFGGTAEATFANGQLALRVERGERGEGGGPRSVQVDAKP